MKPKYNNALNTTIIELQDKKVKKVPNTGKSSFLSISPKIMVGNKSSTEKIKNEYPDLPAFDEYHDLFEAITEAL